MRHGFGMLQRQTAPMRFTPELRQAVHLLQLSTPELLEYIRHEVEENPLLEYPANERYDGGGLHSNPYHDPLLNVSAKEATLERHLQEQLAFIRGLPAPIHRIVLFMIGNLDDKGYLVPTIEEITRTLHAKPEHTDTALTILQSFDPAGVGARDLKECLLLQVRRKDPACPPLVTTLIEGHLHDIAKGRATKLSKLLQAYPEEIRQAVEIVKRLDPRPCSAFHEGEVHYIYPDVIIAKEGEELVVRLQAAAAPRLILNSRYEQLNAECRGEAEAGRFLSEKYRSAKFLVRCLEQRRTTLLRVTHAIVEEQADFFRMGPPYLKPMNLQQIAGRVRLHESTVSRATSGKYAQTPWGIYELKDFFPGGLRTYYGERTSTESIKRRLTEWIKLENVKKPYSDQQLADLFAEQGLPISRRTVAKYREELGIPASPGRKRL